MKISRRKAIEKTVIAAAGSALFTNMAKTSGGAELSESKETYSLKREIPVSQKYDIVVAGGGPAGVAAAICGARLGAKVLLIEATGCLGGMGTSGLVTAFDPMANGEHLLVGGFMKEILLDMHKHGYLGPQEKPEIFTKAYHHWTPFNAEGYKLLLDEKAVDAGVEVRFFTKVIDAEADKESGKVKGVIINNVEGYEFIPSKTFIDCTGDAIMANLCGADCREAGRDTQNIMPATLCSYFCNIDFENSIRVGTEHPILLKAIEDGHFTQTDRHLPGLSRVGDTIGYLNGGHVFNLNALRCDSLTNGMMLGRKIAKEYLSFYKKYVPGFENAEHATTASVMGIRESRRITGEYELNFEDYISKREFPDQIGIFNKSVDIHAYNDSLEEFNRFKEEYHNTGRLKQGEHFGIPYSILIPKGWSNLWVAGCCNSSDIKVHGSIRVQPAASMMGQAAGTAAVQSIKTGQPANDLNTETLVLTLRNEGAILPQKRLSKKMTRI
ncbi:FAD dependent oxidoreductase [Mariniphaga anaerophila]|uniref:FAD dependent oxidoreductase n=1 Tax=Mariniphaga anaerophila TaxID=1484053 RepID=A0A1M4VVY5_9BACT|nr:FAD-dependent oxidoreductase [Mariniphaga anaerophila]SHE72892.1 FAD dependent oxidoreductase [Mariniphaga anaerophila]